MVWLGAALGRWVRDSKLATRTWRRRFVAAEGLLGIAPAGGVKTAWRRGRIVRRPLVQRLPFYRAPLGVRRPRALGGARCSPETRSAQVNSCLNTSSRISGRDSTGRAPPGNASTVTSVPDRATSARRAASQHHVGLVEGMASTGQRAMASTTLAWAWLMSALIQLVHREPFDRQRRRTPSRQAGPANPGGSRRGSRGREDASSAAAKSLPAVRRQLPVEERAVQPGRAPRAALALVSRAGTGAGGMARQQHRGADLLDGALRSG
jgi:hypothetical protein